MNASDFIFRDRKADILFKPPGSINGNGFVLDTLQDCEVYLLDHTSQVRVDDCVNCKIFLGPTDGSVFLRNCRDCCLCVAARQLRTRDCHDLDIALYCATQPSIESSTCLTFSCWRGAYPGLTAHFTTARLDPLKNTWAQVYDFNSKEDLGAPHFIIDRSVRPWWVPPLPPPGADGGAVPLHEHEGQGRDPVGKQQHEVTAAAAADCPVPAADGSLYSGGHVAEAEAPPPTPAVAPAAPPVSERSALDAQLPDQLPRSFGRAAAYDEEVELEDEEEGAAEGEAEGCVGEEGGRQDVDHGQDPASPPPASAPLTAVYAVVSSGSSGGGVRGSMSPALPPPHPHPPFAANAHSDARVAWRVANTRALSERAGVELGAKEATREAARRRLDELKRTRAALLKKRFETNRAHGSVHNPTNHLPTTTHVTSSPGKGGAAVGLDWARVAELASLSGPGTVTRTGGWGSGMGVGKSAGGKGPRVGAAGKAAAAFSNTISSSPTSSSALPGGLPARRDVTRLRQLMLTLMTKHGKEK